MTARQAIGQLQLDDVSGSRRTAARARDGAAGDTDRVSRGLVRLAYRPAELAAMVGLSTKAIYRAVERGEIEAVKVANGTRLLIPVTAAETWLSRNIVAPRRPTIRRGRSRRTNPRPLREALARLASRADQS